MWLGTRVAIVCDADDDVLLLVGHSVRIASLYNETAETDAVLESNVLSMVFALEVRLIDAVTAPSTVEIKADRPHAISTSIIIIDACRKDADNHQNCLKLAVLLAPHCCVDNLEGMFMLYGCRLSEGRPARRAVCRY